ncbi:MAG TPA: hypothetical protein VLJ88_13875 [Propionibacteriaceae bacterium]|nr:hypothetical protein [Propionibacteriaceae bacterium]
MTNRIITDADIVRLKAKIGPDIDDWFAALAPVEEPPPPPPVPTPLGTTSGVWAAHNRADAAAFLKWRGGAAPANVVAFTARETEAKVMSPWWQDVIPSGVRLSLRIPLVPNDDRDLGRRRDQMFTTLARQAAEVDPRAYICPGWEMNLPNWASAVTPANLVAWRAAWTRCYDMMKATAPGLLIGWNPNGGGDQTGIDVRKSYVDGKVDFVGVDQYDCWPGITSVASAALMRTRAGGLEYWAEFARLKKTRLALPEWGCSLGSQWAGHTGGDNPAYIGEIAAFRQRNADIWLFDSYFNEPASYLRSDIWQPGGKTPSCPKAGAAYRQLFGGGTT